MIRDSIKKKKMKMIIIEMTRKLILNAESGKGESYEYAGDNDDDKAKITTTMKNERRLCPEYEPRKDKKKKKNIRRNQQSRGD